MSPGNSKQQRRISWLEIGLLALALLSLGACTTTGPEKPQKWEPKKRAESHVQLGLDYLKRGQFEVAREELDLAISIDPTSDRAYHGKGLLLAQTGQIDEAKEMFNRAVGINQSNFVAANDYGIYLCQVGDYTQGIDILRRNESKPDNNYLSNTHLGLGICHFDQGQMGPAKNYLRSVLEVAPGLPQALLPMAEIGYREQNYLSSRAFIERYIGVGALSEKALALGANTEIKLGDVEKAKQYVRELRRVYPTSSELAKFRSLLGSG